MAVQGIAGVEVEGVYGLLFYIAHAGEAYGVDAFALEVVEQGEVQGAFFVEAGGVGEVGVQEDGEVEALAHIDGQTTG